MDVGKVNSASQAKPDTSFGQILDIEMIKDNVNSLRESSQYNRTFLETKPSLVDGHNVTNNHDKSTTDKISNMVKNLI